MSESGLVRSFLHSYRTSVCTTRPYSLGSKVVSYQDDMRPGTSEGPHDQRGLQTSTGSVHRLAMGSPCSVLIVTGKRHSMGGLWGLVRSFRLRIRDRETETNLLEVLRLLICRSFCLKVSFSFYSYTSLSVFVSTK